MHVTLDRPLYLADDMKTIVEEGDLRARIVIGSRGALVQTPELERLGLSESAGKVVYPGYAEVALPELAVPASEPAISPEVIDAPEVAADELVSADKDESAEVKASAKNQK